MMVLRPSKYIFILALIISGLFGLPAQSLGSEMWAWGNNPDGLYCTAAPSSSSSPVNITTLGSNVKALSSRSTHTLVLRLDGTVWGCGKNLYGQLGTGTTTDSSIPVQVNGLTAVDAVVAGDVHSLALKADGTVWAWGYNGQGQLGDGTISDRLTPVQVSGLTGVVSVAAGDQHSLAMQTDGTVWAWGHNGYGLLGDGTWTNRYTLPFQ